MSSEHPRLFHTAVESLNSFLLNLRKRKNSIKENQFKKDKDIVADPGTGEDHTTLAEIKEVMDRLAKCLWSWEILQMIFLSVIRFENYNLSSRAQ